MSNSVRSPKGTELPLINLKGKMYLMVAYRIQWFVEANEFFDVKTEALRMEKDESVVKATVQILDKDGKVLKSATATKREDAKGFGDHLEKAETGAIGRALAIMGYGTQFALSDLNEGDRLADSPLVPVSKTISTVPRGQTAIASPQGPSGSLTVPNDTISGEIKITDTSAITGVQSIRVDRQQPDAPTVKSNGSFKKAQAPKEASPVVNTEDGWDS